MNVSLLTNNSTNESSGSDRIDFLSNGFKIRTSANGINAATPIFYAAFAENPFKNFTRTLTMLKLDGKTLQYGKAFVHDGMQYPSNWLA